MNSKLIYPYQARVFQTRAPVLPGSLNLLPSGLYKVASNIKANQT